MSFVAVQKVITRATVQRVIAAQSFDMIFLCRAAQDVVEVIFGYAAQQFAACVIPGGRFPVVVFPFVVFRFRVVFFK